MKTSGTLDQMFEALIEQLNREPVEERERHRRLFREAFERMATPDPELESRLSPRVKEWLEKRFPSNSEPLPPLPPGKARVVSF